MKMYIYKGEEFQPANFLLMERMLVLSISLISMLLNNPGTICSKEGFNGLVTTGIIEDDKLIFTIVVTNGDKIRAYIDLIEHHDVIQGYIHEFEKDNPFLKLLP